MNDSVKICTVFERYKSELHQFDHFFQDFPLSRQVKRLLDQREGSVISSNSSYRRFQGQETFFLNKS